MPEVGPPPSMSAGPRRRWPSGFLGLIALVVAVESGLTHAAREYGTVIFADWRRERRAAESEAATQAEILCLGDSLMKTGIIPAALEARLDRTAYNLAGMNIPTPASFFLFKRALDAGARPRAIILDANEPQLWGSRLRHDLPSWSTLIGPADALRLARDDHDLGVLGPFLVHHVLPSVRFRLDFRRTIADRLAGRAATADLPWPELVERQTRQNRGAFLFHVMRPKGWPDPYPGGHLSSTERELCYRWIPATAPEFRWIPFARPTNLTYIDRILELARSRGITVFFVVPPIHPGVLAVRERYGLEKEYLDFMRRVRDRYENVVVVDARHAGFEHDRFIDTSHLNIEGAMALSNSLAEVMASRLDGPPRGDRWAMLPPYAEPPARHAVEGLDESKRALTWWHAIR